MQRDRPTLWSFLVSIAVTTGGFTMIAVDPGWGMSSSIWMMTLVWLANTVVHVLAYGRAWVDSRGHQGISPTDGEGAP
ncbi:hypothetical protein [Nocardiopsis aegyptia]|uniref:Uncharacterized protein n=1 Tax=Nocardiopsis aegyptia TaxID=220378 RepID=A0A7Z0JAS2_9ACTN|nr:hypothetical protein [Nocardiopsis aegyptia]NYJ35087.1 hypothetical protein [Nocardiopsis aegyptia]